MFLLNNFFYKWFYLFLIDIVIFNYLEIVLFLIIFIK